MHIHFTGICGTAMGNVALMMRAAGHTVSGSDEHIYPPMSDLLAQAGIAIMPGFTPDNLQPPPDLVVIGNKVSRGNPEAEAVLNARLAYTSLPELLKHELIQGRTSVVTTGTHGKTTTSALMAWVLQVAGRDPNFMIGGVPENFGSGWQYNPHSNIVVLEGDEYDTAFFDKRSKFVHYLPTALIINNIEFDHADIFDGLHDILLAFRRLVNIVPQNGIIVANGDDPNVASVTANALTPVDTFGLTPHCTWCAADVTFAADVTEFTVLHNGKEEARLGCSLPGTFNVRNALGVVAVARWLEVDYDSIDKALRTFRNTRRRMELKGVFNGVTVYDDFAHHPTAIAETLQAIRLRHPSERLWAVFEPRSNTTRRNVFQQQLARCFRQADNVLLAQIDRADELSPDQRLDTERLEQDIRAAGIGAQFLADVDTIVEHLQQNVRPGDVVVVMSNGGFGGIHGKLKTALNADVQEPETR